jgi:hypothetical protein
MVKIDLAVCGLSHIGRLRQTGSDTKSEDIAGLGRRGEIIRLAIPAFVEQLFLSLCFLTSNAL